MQETQKQTNLQESSTNNTYPTQFSFGTDQSPQNTVTFNELSLDALQPASSPSPEIRKRLPIDNRGEKYDDNKDPYKFSKQVLFVIGGMLTFYMNYLVIAQSVIFDERFEGANYSFYVVLPSHLCVPFAIIGSKLFAKWKLSLNSKMYISLTGALIFFLAVPFMGLYLPNDILHFWMMIGVLLVGSVFNAIFQAILTTFASGYQGDWMQVVFQTQSMTNLILMILKNISVWLELSDARDFILFWGLFFLLNLVFIYFFYKLSKTEEFRNKIKGRITENDTRSFVEKKRSKVNFKESWRIVKPEAMGVFFANFLMFISYPGIFFSCLPPTLMKEEQYIVILNTLAGIFEAIGPNFSNCSFSKPWIKVSRIIAILFSAALISIYFMDLVSIYEGLIYTMFVAISFTLMRVSFSLTYYMIKANEKANESTLEGIGSLMTYMLLLGISVGNLVSGTLPLIKDYLLQDK